MERTRGGAALRKKAQKQSHHVTLKVTLPVARQRFSGTINDQGTMINLHSNRSDAKVIQSH